MTAAIAAARLGAEVILLEKGDLPGRKIEMTGNGRCNLTHLPVTEVDYYTSKAEHLSEVRAYIASLLEGFGSAQTLRFFEEIGVETVTEDGYVYPFAGQASAVSQALRLELKRLGVSLRTGAQLRGAERVQDGSLLVKLPEGESIRADALILATGGKAGPKSTHSTGDAYYMAAKLGAEVSEALPALTSLKLTKPLWHDRTGVRTEAQVRFYEANRGETPDLTDSSCFAIETGEVQILPEAISGIPVMQASGRVAAAMHAGGDVHALLDFFPQLTVEEYRARWERRLARPDSGTLEDVLNGFQNARLCSMVLQRMGLEPQTQAAQVSRASMEALFAAFRAFPVQVSACGGFEQAQVTTGGVLTSSLTPELELKTCPGVYIAGELLDVDGRCGGYNLQFAFTTGVLAGIAAAGCRDRKTGLGRILQNK